MESNPGEKWCSLGLSMWASDLNKVLSAPTGSLKMTSSWMGIWINSRVGRLFRDPGQAGLMH